MEGKIIGGYTVIEPLGSGSFGTTYKVFDANGGQYALKESHGGSANDERQRMLNEIWSLRKLDHPCIPKVVDVDPSEDVNYFVMELVQGVTLNSALENRRVIRGRYSEAEVLTIMECLLSALEHMHKKDVVHRDIKPANIIINKSINKATLIDFGLCKAPGAPGKTKTFWHAGNSLCCPADKLHNPSLKGPKDDVYSVGVIAYMLLTLGYPWEVPEKSDVGERKRITSLAPTPITQLDHTISQQLSGLVHRLFDQREFNRPDAANALKEVVRLKRDLSSEKGTYYASRTITYNRVSLDSVHGDIRMSEFEWKIVQTPEFQRLRRIKQLGMTNLVYVDAEHTRMSHSMGTMYVADRILNAIRRIHGSISDDFELTDDETIRAARLYALTHDATHIPFGHTLEDELGIFSRHDENSGRQERLILDKKSVMGELLKNDQVGLMVRGHFDKESSIVKHSFIKDIIASPVGADVVDYIDRDSKFCGLHHRVDPAIYRRYNLSMPEGGLLMQSFGKHGLRLDANLLWETIPLERFQLFLKVYTHPVKVSAGAMLGKALWEAIRSVKDGGFSSQFKEERIERMGDIELLLRLSEGPKTYKGAGLISRIFDRKIYKPVFRAPVMEEADFIEGNFSTFEIHAAKLKGLGYFDPLERQMLERKLANLSNLKEYQVVFYCPPKPPGLSSMKYKKLNATGSIDKIDETARNRRDLVGKHFALWNIFVFCDPDLTVQQRKKLAAVCELELVRSNTLPEFPSGRLF